MDCLKNKGAIIMPLYAICIIGILMAVMFFTIICLAILIYRIKSKNYKILLSPESPVSKSNYPDMIQNFRRQQSQQEMKILKINSIPADLSVTDENSYHNNKSSNSLNVVETPTNTVRRNTKTSSFGKDTKQTSGENPSEHKMILREQMKKICEDALAKSQCTGITASLRDLHELLQNNDIKEKSASHPELDIYEETPSNKPVNGFIDEVYDCLPSSNNIVVQDLDTQYMLTLSKNNVCESEPSYINAFRRYD